MKRLLRPGDNNGRADLYASYILNTVKPHIDATCRTLTDPANNGALGSSMGGVVSFYSGVRTQRIVPPNRRDEHRVVTHPRLHQLHEEPTCAQQSTHLHGLWRFRINQRRQQRRRLLRLARHTRQLHRFTPPASSKYALVGTYKFLVGFGQIHNVIAWAARLSCAHTFLYPSQGEPKTLLRTHFSARVTDQRCRDDDR